MTATKRKPAKAVKSQPLTDKEKAYLATLSPKLRKINLLVRPLQGKLTKALEMK
ncbi:MAG: hypothetical protein Q7J38_16800 [Gallionella sp.]|nr:hypothetical protein [Gallionella sp.]